VVLNQAPENAQAQLGLARVAIERNDQAEAVKRLRKCLGNPATEKPARALLAELYHRRGDSRAAERERRLAARLPDRGLFQDPLVEGMLGLMVGRLGAITRADQFLQQGRTQEAIDLLEETARNYPDSGAVWLALGRCCLHGKQLARAERALRTAQVREPRQAEPPFYLGQALVEQERTDEAAGCFQQAIALRADFVEAHFNLGRCLWLKGKRAEAIKEFQAVLRYKPSDVMAHVQLGELLGKENPAEARKHLELALSLDPDTSSPAHQTARKLLETLPR
jgi:tetratricopeptide (TPR) repeat protein